jgi:hypothetical protein
MGRVPLAVATVPADAILKNCRRFGCWGDDIVVSSALYSCENDVGAASTAGADLRTVFSSSGNPAGLMYIPRQLLLSIIYRATRLRVVMQYYATEFSRINFFNLMRRRISFSPEKIEFLPK